MPQEREKKLKKKAAAAASEITPEDPAETVEEAAEPENLNEIAEAPVTGKERAQKEVTVRARYRTKGPESVPKAILKRKKSTNYWVWAAPVAAACVVVVLLFQYYLMRK